MPVWDVQKGLVLALCSVLLPVLAPSLSGLVGRASVRPMFHNILPGIRTVQARYP